MSKWFRKLVSKTEDGLPTLPVDVGTFAIPPEIDGIVDIDPKAEKAKNRQYRESLAREAPWVNKRLKLIACETAAVENFEVLGFLGQGSFGRVSQVKRRGTEEIYAMKVQIKREIVASNIISNAINERRLLSALDFEFIVRLCFAIKDARNLYLVMEYACYGDVKMTYRLHKPESSVKLTIAQIILGIEYLHECKIAHRDIKGDNVFIYHDGYIKIGETVPQFKESLRRGTLAFPRIVYPDSAVNDLLSGFLNKRSYMRLGMGKDGSDEIKDHAWFADISFTDVFKKAKEIEMRPTMVVPRSAEGIQFLPQPGERDYKPKLFKDF